jgi:tetratricopeptide (TPR) repeat protein
LAQYTPETESRKLPAWTIAVVAAAAVLVYINTLWNDFVFDDIPIVRQNPNIRGLSKLPVIFSSGYGEDTQMGFTALYRPLVILSLAANYQAGGLAPWHYHLANALLHAANALLVLLLAFRLTRGSLAAAAAGLLFALHPVNSEAVSPVVGRTDLLGTFFVLCSLLLYAKCASGGKRMHAFLAGSLACLAFGLLSKEHAVVTVGLVMLWDLAARDKDIAAFLRNLPRRLAFPYSLYIGLVGAYLGVRYAVVGKLGVGGTISVIDNPLVALGEPLRTLTAGKVSLAYLTRLLAPVTLAHDYSYPQIAPAGAPESLAFLFVLAVFVWALVYSYRKNRHIFYGLAFLAIGYSIISNLAFNIGTIMAERLLYLPGIGFAIAVGALLEAGRRYVAEKKSRKLAAAATVAVVAAIAALFGARTFLRTADWRSQLTLYRQAILVVPNNAKVHMGYGQTLSEHGEYDAALNEFDTALGLLAPNERKWFSAIIGDIRFDMANIYKKQRRYPQAVEAYELSLSFRPGHLETMFNYGKALLESGKSGPARNVFTEIVRSDPAFHEAYNELGLAHEALGDYRRAEKAYLECTRLKPDYAPVHRNLFMLYGQHLPDSDKAAHHLQRTLELDPDQPDADRLREFLRKYRQQKGGAK